METLFKIMLGYSLLERMAKAVEQSKLFTDQEQNFIVDEFEKIINKKSGE